MPYVPTNCYPHNCAVERGGQTIFLGTSDSHDYIVDAEIELLDPNTNKIESVISLKNKKAFVVNNNTYYEDSNTLVECPSPPYSARNNLISCSLALKDEIITRNTEGSDVVTVPCYQIRDKSSNENANKNDNQIYDAFDFLFCFPVSSVGYIYYYTTELGEKDVTSYLDVSRAGLGHYTYTRTCYFNIFFSTSNPTEVLSGTKENYIDLSSENIKIEAYSLQGNPALEDNSYIDFIFPYHQKKFQFNYDNTEYFVAISIKEGNKFRLHNDAVEDYENEADYQIVRFSGYQAAYWWDRFKHEKDIGEHIQISVSTEDSVALYLQSHDSYVWRFLLRSDLYDILCFEGKIEETTLTFDSKPVYKIPTSIQLPNTIKDNFNRYYFVYQDIQPFYYGEIANVKQIYNNGTYDYTITFTNNLDDILPANRTNDFFVSLGTYNLNDESIEISNNRIEFTSSIPYLLPNQSLEQRVLITFERSYAYVQVYAQEPYIYWKDIEKENETTFTRITINENPIILSDDELQTSIILKTNSIYSNDFKFDLIEEYEPNLKLNIKNKKIKIENDRDSLLSKYSIKIIKDEMIINETINFYSPFISYEFPYLLPDNQYLVRLEAETSHNFRKILDFPFNSLKYESISSDFIIYDNKNKANIIKLSSEQLPIPWFDLNTESWYQPDTNYIWTKLDDITNIEGDVFLSLRATIYRYRLDEQDNIIEQSLLADQMTLEPTWKDENSLVFNSLFYDYGIDNENRYQYEVFYEADKVNISDITISNDTVALQNIKTEDVAILKSPTQLIDDWIGVCLYGTKYNQDENEQNRYELDPAQVWYFDLDTKADTINYNTERNIFINASALPKVTQSNVNYMSQSITTKLGYLNEDDLYVEDNGQKLNKFAEFANNETVKILRLRNGYLIPVDIALKNRTTNYALVDTPGDITFDWTQIKDHKTSVLYSVEKGGSFNVS